MQPDIPSHNQIFDRYRHRNSREDRKAYNKKPRDGPPEYIQPKGPNGQGLLKPIRRHRNARMAFNSRIPGADSVRREKRSVNKFTDPKGQAQSEQGRYHPLIASDQEII